MYLSPRVLNTLEEMDNVKPVAVLDLAQGDLIYVTKTKLGSIVPVSSRWIDSSPRIFKSDLLPVGIVCDFRHSDLFFRLGFFFLVMDRSVYAELDISDYLFLI